MSRLWSTTTGLSCVSMMVGVVSKYKHRVGGLSAWSGQVPAGGTKPIHLIMTLDLSDPSVPFSQPGIRELPLFHPFVYDGSRISYRVVGEHAIEIVKQPERNATDNFPFENYPDSFPSQPVALSEPISMEECFNEDSIRADWEAELEQAVSENRVLDDNDKIAFLEGLMQGPPRTICRTPDCNGQAMKLLTVIRGDFIEGFNFWSDSDYGPDVAITYEYCPNCYLIHTENQCG